jgi:hypothetical protein
MPGRSGRDEMQGLAPSKPRVYGAPMGAPTPSNAVGRPQVGAAPPQVQRQAIQAHEAAAARESRAGLYQKPLGATARPSPTLAVPNAQSAPAVLGAAQQIQGRPAMIDQAVDAANKGDTP